VTESDFEALNIRLGDRRKLQREIARRQLWPENSPLPTSDELRDFTNSLQDHGIERTNNGYFHHQVFETIESDRVSQELDEPLTLAVSPLILIFTSHSLLTNAGQESPPMTQNEGPQSIKESPSSTSDPIPPLELEAETFNEYDSIGGTAPTHIVAAETFDDDVTPKANDRAVSPSRSEKFRDCIERVR